MDALETNKVVQRIKSHSVKLKIHSIPESEIRRFIISDAAFDPSGRTKPQHGWIQGMTNKDMSRELDAPVSLISWKSRRLRRKAGSIMLCESISLSTALCALEKQIAFWDSIRLSRYDVRKQREDKDDKGMRVEPTVVATDDPSHNDPLSLAIVDAKSVFDASATEQATGEDDRSTMEIAIIQDSLNRCSGRVRWVPHTRNPSDMLTKLQGAHEVPTMQLLRTSSFRIQDEEVTLAEGRQGERRQKSKYGSQQYHGADISHKTMSQLDSCCVNLCCCGSMGNRP
eukprot:s3579_g20.t1